MGEFNVDPQKVDIPHNFGHRVRTGRRVSRVLYSALTYIFGVSNLIKRQQMHDLFAAMQLKADDHVLDFGCTSGYISIEMAKKAGRVDGLDVVDIDVVVPDKIRNKLEFHTYNGNLTEIPFEANQFTKILASEVVYVFEDFNVLFAKFNELLKDGGELIILNGIGRPVIKKAYEKNGIFMRLLKKLPTCPNTFDEYQKKLHEEFRAAYFSFPDEEKFVKSLQECGFDIKMRMHTPTDAVVRVTEWYQFLFKILFNRAVAMNTPVLFPFMHLILSVIRRFSTRRDLPAGILIVACKRD